eukprot:124636-Heterocapsa_arctica.AAC.1
MYIPQALAGNAIVSATAIVASVFLVDKGLAELIIIEFCQLLAIMLAIHAANDLRQGASAPGAASAEVREARIS